MIIVNVITLINLHILLRQKQCSKMKTANIKLYQLYA